jgi:hypothetical protein
LVITTPKVELEIYPVFYTEFESISVSPPLLGRL